MISRKTFLKQMGLASAGLSVCGAMPLTSYGRTPADTRITIMHTNDTHARMEPFPEGSGEYAGLGGVARRAALIQRIRAESPHNLLLDAGDVFQGTPFFNFYHGALDLELMSMMGYDATTLGNHEFDNQVDGFVRVAPKAQFPYVSSNYDFSGAPAMAAFVRPYLVKTIASVRIGLFGLGVSFENLVLPHLHEGVTYSDPIPVAAHYARWLRAEQGCQMVIALSHLGYEHPTDMVSDRVVAAAVDGIDLIIGGHTHTLLAEPVVIEKPGQRPTVISQVGHAGVVLGRLDYTFNRTGQIARVGYAHQAVES